MNPLDPGAAPADSPRVLDCGGQRCPVPVITLARLWREVATGEVVTVIADDPAAASDIPAWCRMRGEEFVAVLEIDRRPAYQVRRTSMPD